MEKNSSSEGTHTYQIVASSSQNDKIDGSTRYNSIDSTDTKDFSIFNDKYHIIKELGFGNTSTVYLCESIKNLNEKVALKLYKKEYILENEKNTDALISEVSILASCNHKNII